MSQDAVQEGWDAFARGGAAYFDDRFEAARADWELAFRTFRDAGQLCQAARVATALGELHWGSLGNEAAGRGWIERSRRMLEQVGPCVEWGYWELARAACDRPDVEDLARSAERALALAHEHGDAALEVRALADSGLALVTMGRVTEGFSRLGEALATVTGGEVRDPAVVGMASCAVVSSCDRAGDVALAEEWIRLVREHVLAPQGERPRLLATHCQVAYGSVLWNAGRCEDAERTILDALSLGSSRSANHRNEAKARLAAVRVDQGRFDEASGLLADLGDHVAAAGPLAAVHVHRGEPELAAGVLRSAIRRLVGDVLRGAPLLSALVEVEVGRGDVAAARQALELLGAMDAAVDAPLVHGLYALGQGRVARAEGHAGDAVAHLEAARARLAGGQAPLVALDATIALAEVQASLGDDALASATARAAHAEAFRLGSRGRTDRAAALLRRLGVAPPRRSSPANGLAGLTAREVEVLDGIRRGDTNAEIAARLYLSPKTVEHHVGRVLAKLGVRTRAEAAALAATARSGDG